MYKCFKKINGEWQEDADATAILQRKAEELERQGSWFISGCVQEHAETMGFVRALNAWNDQFYYKDDCGVMTFENGSIHYVKEYTTEELKTVDNDTLKSKYGVVRCEHCGKFIQSHYAIKVGRKHYYCNNNCASHHATRCNHCGNWYMKASSFTTETVYGLTDTSENYKLCNNCFENLQNNGRIGTCVECGRLSYRPQRLYVDGTSGLYCTECASHHVTPQIIRGYHDQHNEGWTKQHATYEKTDKHTYYCGVELECEVKNNDLVPNDVAYQIHKVVNSATKLFEFERDGSLNNGYETISQPCTMAWWHENSNLIKTMLDKMTELGCKSHNTTTCGLHIHIGRNFFTDYEYETRFVSLFYRFKNELIKFSRRDINCMEYCSFQRSFDKTKVFLCKKSMEGHNTALNLANEHTIEVRIFKGTLDYASYMSCIELCYNMACYVKDHTELTSDNIDNVTFQDIISYQPTLYLENYLHERHFFDGKGGVQ